VLGYDCELHTCHAFVASTCGPDEDGVWLTNARDGFCYYLSAPAERFAEAIGEWRQYVERHRKRLAKFDAGLDRYMRKELIPHYASQAKPKK
jgi:hypothetical protein